MKRKILALTLVSFLLLTTSPLALAQTTPPETAQDWQELQRLKAGKQIMVEFKPGLGEPVAGKFVSLVGSQLTLAVDGFHFTVEQREIQKVFRLKGKWERSKSAKVGAAVGMLTGTFVGVAMSVENERRPNRVSTDADHLPSIVGFFVGTLVGGGLGALFGGKSKTKLLYEAK